MQRRPAVFALVLVVAATFGLTSCGYRHEAYRLDERSKVAEELFDLHYVEADDEGWFWQPEQADLALEAVEQSAERRDTFVLLFVHGWHHSSRCCDSNVQSFRKTLVQLHDELSRNVHADARAAYSQAEKSGRDFKVIGIYVGWRGRSLPGFLDYFTFWGRKSAAERVGEADVREFIARLNQTYLEKRSDRERGNFLGLISIGHSFGAQVLLRATAATLEQQLISLNAPPGWLRQPAAAAPAESPKALQGIGDLVVLLNPATEAAAYHRLHLLSMAMRYQETQTPVMLTISTDNDYARHKLFTFGRVLGEFFTAKPRKPDALEREAERKALGIDGKHVRHATHRIEPVDPREKLVKVEADPGVEPGCDRTGDCLADWRVWAELPGRRILEDLPLREDTQAGLDRLRDFDFSAKVRLGNVEMNRGEGGIAFQPLIVATTGKAIVDNHSGIFAQPLLRFLIPYIALIETKLALNAEEDVEKKQRALRQ
ncbi:MAG: hypothetical protein ACREVI_12450 [Steroidobacteraceae bacterium]